MENQTTATEQPKPTKKIPGIAKMIGFKTDKSSVLIAILILAILGVLFSYKSWFIAAIVDGSPISRLSVIRELEKNSGGQALDIIITKKLIEAEAAKAGVTVSQSDIDAEMKTIEDQIVKQGGTLDMALAQQGITKDQLREQIGLQKKMEKILADKVQVADEEVNQYLAQSKMTAPKGTSDEDFKNQIREQLKGQKFNTEVTKWIAGLKAAAKIQYYVNYGKPVPAPSEAPVSSQGQ